ncbi:MAG: tetratricopeptide repeat protein [Acidobacteria bacterium]|nr:tetratricopeptide repeat protein [Acidobacteriota bacterium]
MRRAAALVALTIVVQVSAVANAQTAGEAPYHFALGKILIDEGAYAEAGDHLEKAVAAVPDDPYLRIEYADYLLNSGAVEAATVELATARSLAPDDPRVLKAVGQLQLQAARRRAEVFDQARTAFERLRSMDPGDLEVMSTLGRIYLSEERFAEAAEVFRQALGYWPQSRTLHGSLIDALLRSGAMTEAETAIEDSLRVHPASIRARLTLSGLRRRRGDRTGAAEVLSSTPRESGGESALFRQLAGALYEFELFSEALYWLDRSLDASDADPAEPRGLFLRALLLTAQGRREEARADLERLLQIEPDRTEALQLLVRHLFAAGQWSAVAELLEPRLAGELDGSKAELALLHSEALSQLGRAEEALDWLARAAGVPQVRDRALARQAETLLGLGLGEEADEVLRHLTAPGTREVLLLAAEACQRKQNFERSVPYLEELLAQGHDELETLFWLGAAYERTGREAEAEGQFRRYLEREPNSAPALNYLGYMWADNGENLDEALEMVQRAVALDPDNGAYVDSLGWAYFRLGSYAEALSHLERAAGLVEDPVVLEHLGDVYSALGQREEAAERYRSALTLEAENAAQVEEKLRQLGTP